MIVLNTSNRGGGNCGTSTLQLAGGKANPSTRKCFCKKVNTWNGTTWTEVNDLNTIEDYGSLGGLEHNTAL